MTELYYETCEKCGYTIKEDQNIAKVKTGISRQKNSFFRRFFDIFKSGNILTTRYYHLKCLKSNHDDPEKMHLEAQDYIKQKII